MDSASLKHEVAARILSLKREGEENDAEFARRIGVSSQIVNNYRSKRYGASVDVVYAIVRKTGIDADWLVMGKPEGGGVLPVGREEVGELRAMLSDALALVDRLEAATRPDEDAERIAPGESSASLPPRDEQAQSPADSARKEG